MIQGMYSLSKILRRSWRFNITRGLQVSNGTSASVHDEFLGFVGLYNSRSLSSSFSVDGRLLFTKVEAKDGGDSDAMENGFSGLEAAYASVDVQEADSGSEFGDDEEASGEALEYRVEQMGENETKQRRTRSELYEAIVSNSTRSVRNALEAWVKEGKHLTRSEVSLAIHHLRKRKLYSKNLQLYQWLEANKQIELTEEDYGYYVHLFARVHGLLKAEEFIEKIPESLKGETIYSSLLARCAVNGNVKKAEEVFNKMKKLKLPISLFSYHQLLLLYSKQDKKKIPEIISLMENENVKPNRITYRILIHSKGLSGDITGMEQIMEIGKEEGVEHDPEIQAAVAKYYIAAGLKEKAKEIMMKMERENIEENPWILSLLLPLYAEIGEEDQVERLWKVCEQTLRYDNCCAVMRAWGKLKRIEKAEAVFEKLKQKYKIFPIRPFFVLMRIYTDNKMLVKGKESIKQMEATGLKVGPFIWDALVKLFVGSGEVEKADLILNKAMKDSPMKPMYNTLIILLEEYAKRGDVYNSEKILRKMKEAGYTTQLRQYEAIILAYLKSKSPAYGMKERMRADNVFPSKRVSEKLSRIDPFRKTVVSDPLDDKLMN